MSPRKKGMLAGIALIVGGIVKAMWTYVSDSNSLDYFRITNAFSLAALHAILFCAAGTAVLAWFWFSEETHQDD